MSLKVWLPLNGDLRNLGCSEYAITPIETTPLFTNGKIGQCYQRANTNTQLTNGLRLESNLMDLFGDTVSIAVWIKPLGTHTHYNGTIISSGNWNAKKWAFGVSQDNSKVDVLCGSYNNYIACNVPANEWTHLVSIYDNGTCLLYKNGEYVGQLANQKAFETDATWTGIGRETYASGYFGFNGCINDLRIYDHCLSPLEIKEISQGLVLHYKLDSKYIENTTNLYSGTFSNTCYNGATNKYGYGTNTDIYKTTGFFQGKNSVKIYMGTAGLDAYPYIYFDAFNTTGTNVHTLSFDYYPTTQTSIIPYSYNGAYNISYITSNGDSNTLTNTSQTTIPVIVNQWNHISITMQKYDTTNTTRGNGYIRIGSAKHTSTTTDYWLFANIQVEAKDHETGYTGPGTTRNNTIIQDSSGYNNNGTITGDLTCVSDIKRYLTGVKLNCSDPTTNNNTGLCYIQSRLSLTTPSKMTIAWWAKPESGYSGSTAHAAFCTSNKDTVPDDYNTTAFHHRDNGFDIYPSDGSGVKRLSFVYTQNTWHHYAITYDGTTARAYQDGIEKSSITIGAGKTLASFSQLYIGFSKAGGVWRKTLGSYSDFRIYVTQLLDADIKKLYNTSMSIDNSNNIHTYELDEKGRELLNGVPLTAGYSTHSTTSNIFNGEVKMTGNGSLGSNYIKINPTGHTYYYDIIYSCATGNQFYIGFEKYDASKTARSNNACVYVVAVKPTTDQAKVHVKGTVDLATDGVNPTDTIALRILNGWSGSDSSSTKTMTIHYMSLREVATNQKPQVLKSGEFVVEELREYNNAKFYQIGMIETAGIIEM